MWRTSSHTGNGLSCVEVRGTLDAVRDSKNPAGATLRADIPALIRAIRTGRLA